MFGCSFAACTDMEPCVFMGLLGDGGVEAGVVAQACEFTGHGAHGGLFVMDEGFQIDLNEAFAVLGQVFVMACP